MTTRDIIEHLVQTQHDATENQAVDEIPESELDQISGAGRDGSSGWRWDKAIHK